MAKPVEDPPFHGGSRGGGRPTTPSITHGLPPRGHDRDAGVAADDELARFARLLRSKHDPPLDVAVVDKDGNCLFHVVLLQVYGNALAHAEVRRRCLNYMEAKTEHYRDFVAGSTPPPPKMTTTTMRDTTRGQRGARQLWGGGQATVGR